MLLQACWILINANSFKNTLPYIFYISDHIICKSETEQKDKISNTSFNFVFMPLFLVLFSYLDSWVTYHQKQSHSQNFKEINKKIIF